MLKNINKVILFFLIVLLGFSLYKLLIINNFYPYSLLVLGTVLSIGMYFSLMLISKIHVKFYIVLSLFAFLNSSLLFADYYYPNLLKTTWNYSFTVLFIVLITALLIKTKTIHGKLATFTFWSILLSGIVIGTALLFKISSAIYYSLVSYTFLVSTIAVLLLFGSQFKKVKKAKISD